MDNLRRLGNHISIPIAPDADRFTGRECPNPECEGYFKVEFGTGLKEEGIPCHCPYCGCTEQHDKFWTKAQIEYAESIALKKITDAFHKDLKKLEFDYKPRGPFGIGLSMTVKPGQPIPIRNYREKKLETEVVCDNCTLRYTIYGVFAFCPDCGQHNSLQILNKNLELISKMLDMASKAEKELADHLVRNALEDCVSSFDGFGRELCRVYANKASAPYNAEKLSFQSIEKVKQILNVSFGISLTTVVSEEDWRIAVRGFQKRHLLSHKMGIVDGGYIQKTGDTQVVAGRKICISAEEVRRLIDIVRKFSCYISEELKKR
ncbi:MAG: hypothetical protein ABSG99_00670 [Sedimentisphaerales bacterium]